MGDMKGGLSVPDLVVLTIFPSSTPLIIALKVGTGHGDVDHPLASFLAPPDRVTWHETRRKRHFLNEAQKPKKGPLPLKIMEREGCSGRDVFLLFG